MAQDSTPEQREEHPEDDKALRQARAALSASSGGRLGHEFGSDPGAKESMFTSLQQELEREDRGWLAGLRARSTSARLGWVLGGLSLLVALRARSMAVEGHVEVTPRVMASLVVLALLMGTLAVLGLRPLHRPALPWRAELAAVFGSLLCVFALSLWPTLGSHVADLTAAPEAWRCFGMGTLVAAAVYGAVRVVHRGTWIGGLFAALLAGVAANLVLTTHCPAAEAGHTLLGHFLVMAVAGAAYVVGSRVTES